MADTSLIFNIIARDSGLGKALNGIEKAFRSAGQEAQDSLNQASQGTENLDRMIAEAQARVRGLSEEFERTGDKTIFGKVSRDRSLISNLERMRAALKDTAGDSGELGSAGDRLDGVFSRLWGSAQSLGSSLSGMSSQVGGAVTNIWSLITVAVEISAAMTFAAPAIYAFGGAAASLPGMLSGAIAAIATLKLGMSGLSANWAAMNAPATGGGGGGGGGAIENMTPKIRAVEAAQRQVARSARDVTDAQSDLRDAIAGVNKARIEEKERIEDVRVSLLEAKADEEDSVQSLAEARMALALAEQRGNPDEIRRAQIAVDKQAASLEEAKDKTEDLQKESDEAAKKGVEGSDAVVAAKKQETEANRRVQDAVQAHRLAIQQLGDAQDDLKRKTAGAAGAAGGLAATVPKIAASAREFLEELKRLKPAFDDLRLDVQQHLFEGLAGKLQILAERWLPALHIGLDAMADTMNGVVKTAFDSLSNPTFIKNTMIGVDAFRQSLGTVGQAIAGPLVDAWGRLSAAASPFIIMLGQKLAGIIIQFSGWIKKADETGKLQAFFATATHVTGKLFDIFTDLARITGDVISILFGTQGGSTDAWDNLAAVIHKLADYLGNPEVQAKISKFFDFFGSAAFWIGDMLAALDNIHTGIENALAWIHAFPTNAGAFLSRLPSIVAHWISAAISQLGYWIGYGIGWAIRQFINLPGNVGRALAALPGYFARIGTWLMNAVRQLPGWMANIGRNIVIGIWNGIVNMSSWLYNQTYNFAAGILRGIKAALGIASLSKRAASEVGHWIPAGIAFGMDKNAGAVTDASQRLSDSLMNTRMGLPTVDGTELSSQLDMAANGTISVQAANRRRQEVRLVLDVKGTDSAMKTVIQKMARTSNLYQSKTA